MVMSSLGILVHLFTVLVGVHCWTEYCFSNFLGEYIHLIFDNGTSLNCDLQNFGAIKDKTVTVEYEKYPEYCKLVSTVEPSNTDKRSIMLRIQSIAADYTNIL